MKKLLLSLLFSYVDLIRKKIKIKQLHRTSQIPVQHQVDGIDDDKAVSEVFCNKLSVTLNKHASHSFNSTSFKQSFDESTLFIVPFLLRLQFLKLSSISREIN